MYTETYDKDVHGRVNKKTGNLVYKRINKLWYIHSTIQLLKEQVERSRAN